jgi:hypothetical protein
MVAISDFAEGARGMSLDQYNCRDLLVIRACTPTDPKNIHDCFTQSSFFQMTFLLRLLLFLSLCLPLLSASSPVLFPFVMRGPRSLFACDCRCGGDPRYIASSGASSVLSVGIERVLGMVGNVAPRARGGNREVGVVGECGVES